MINLKQKHEKCWYCENYYGPCFDEPVCLTCHYFIFPNIIEHDLESVNNGTNNGPTSSSNASNSVNGTEVVINNFDDNESNNIVNRSNLNNILTFDEKSDSNDSGNEDSDNFSDQQHVIRIDPYQTSNNNNNNNDEVSHIVIDKPYVNNKIKTKKLSKRNDLDKMDPLNDQIMALSLYSERDSKPIESGLVESLPTEVLWSIFRNLDDLSLWSVSLVCKRWNELISQAISEKKWKSFITNRWVLFKPSIKVNSYQTLYSQLVQSSNCFYCLQKTYYRSKSQCGDEFKKSWRHKRLLLELKALQQDPPDGINAKPLDASCFYWQASITGPNGSPYEGGIFYLYLQIPQSYPLNPPLVRFITKIYHPNISKHGDIGLDSIHENWSLALTISKVLISIQSLLTDPYTHVCMENEIGNLYKTNRELYEKNAKLYTLKYAMNDYLSFENQKDLIEYFNLMLDCKNEIRDRINT